MTTGALNPVRAGDEVIELIAVFDVGSSGDMTLKYGHGIASCADTATGKYTVTFTDPPPVLLSLLVTFKDDTGVDPLVAQEVVDTFSLADKKAYFEVSDMAGTLAEPASGSDCVIRATFLKTA